MIILSIVFETHQYDIDGSIGIRHWYKQNLLINGKYDMNSDKNKGEISLRNYLVDLYVNEKISKELIELLHNHVLIFDTRN